MFQFFEWYDPEARVSYMQWTTGMGERRMKTKDDTAEKVPVRVTVKKELESSLGKLLDLFQSQLVFFKRHLFCMRNQFRHYRELKKEMKSHECPIHVDFSENYACKYASEIQSVYFVSSQQQATLHTGIVHMGEAEYHKSFCSFSSSKEKGPSAIWAHLSPTLDHLKTFHPSVSVIHFFSDGPCTQYRQKGNFFFYSALNCKGVASWLEHGICLRSVNSRWSCWIAQTYCWWIGESWERYP